MDIVFVKDVGLSGADDPDILIWAADNDRVVLTHDRATMPDCAYDLLNASHALPGVLILNDQNSIGESIRQILFVAALSEQAEWNGKVVHLPL